MLLRLQHCCLRILESWRARTRGLPLTVLQLGAAKPSCLHLAHTHVFGWNSEQAGWAGSQAMQPPLPSG